MGRHAIAEDPRAAKRRMEAAKDAVAAIGCVRKGDLDSVNLLMSALEPTELVDFACALAGLSCTLLDAYDELQAAFGLPRTSGSFLAAFVAWDGQASQRD